MRFTLLGTVSTASPTATRRGPPPSLPLRLLELPATRRIKALRIRGEDGVAELHVGRDAPRGPSLAFLIVLGRRKRETFTQRSINLLACFKIVSLAASFVGVSKKRRDNMGGATRLDRRIFGSAQATHLTTLPRLSRTCFLRWSLLAWSTGARLVLYLHGLLRTRTFSCRKMITGQALNAFNHMALNCPS